LDFFGSEDSDRAVRHAALKTEEAKSDTKALINQFGSRGHLQFREMLQS
jgi:hypothetical protein